MSTTRHGLLLCLLGGLAGCHGSESNPTTTAQTTSTSTSTGTTATTTTTSVIPEAIFPHPAESEVPVNSQIRLHLPQTLSGSATIQATAFQLATQESPNESMPLQVSQSSSHELLLTPERPLALNTHYQLRYLPQDRADAEPWQLTFTTEQRSDYPVKLPQPEGEFGVGELPTLLFSRTITPSEEGGEDTRPIDMQIWYPVSKIFHGSRAPYLQEEMSALGEESGFSSRSLNDIVRTNSRLGEQGECSRPHPLILFSPGYGELSQFYRVIIEPLVARGYVVAGVNHASTALLTRSGDGELASADPIPLDLPAAELQAWQQQKLDDNVEDLESAIARIALESSADTPIKGCVDLQHIGLLGHSFGGATAMEALVTHDHYLAAVNLDGDLFGKHHITPSNRAVLQLQSVAGIHDNSMRERDDTLSGEHYWLEVAQSDHLDFSDLHWYQEYLQGPMADSLSSLEPAQMVEIERRWLGAFFDRELKRQPVALEDLPLDGVRLLP